MQRYFSEQTILRMREEIAAAGGNEVFFLGTTDEQRLVVGVEPLARGNRDAVAAILIAVSFGDVVIHNHPSGKLTPSTPDIEIASVLGNQGVGFYIVDNDVTDCYQAVAPFARKSIEPLALPEIEHLLSPGGPIATSLDGYEHRPEQVRMAFAVAEAFNVDRVAVVEAGTGTGKSLAYLLPAVLWAVRNKERVVVSTNTINLQEQLIKKDLPFLREHAGITFRAVLVKGRGNYLCRRKLETVQSEPSLFPEVADELEAIVAWGEQTPTGCRDDLPFIPKSELWEEVNCEADQCGRVKCPNYQRCFFYTARRAAAGADILVVNHALLMADLAVRRETGYAGSAILPPFERLIIDEGHHLENVVTGHLSLQVTQQGVLKTLSKLQHPKKPQRGLIPRLSALLTRELPEELDDLYEELAALLEGVLVPELAALKDEVVRGLDGLAVALNREKVKGGAGGGDRRVRVTPDLTMGRLWQENAPRLQELARRLQAFARRIDEFCHACARLPERVGQRMTGPVIDLKGICERLICYGQTIGQFLAGDEEVCRWFEVVKGKAGSVVRLCAAPLEVARMVRAVILDKFKTVVITSATLAVEGRFDFLAERTGISLLPRERVVELLLPSPFDYERQAFIGIPSDMPEPTARGYEVALADTLREALYISLGRAFVLFTSYDLLMRVHGRLAKDLLDAGLVPLRQGEMNRHLLLSRFRNSPGAVLFGTDSFWEGVDVQGKALELVVITRLPFRVPTDPVQEARAEQIAARGGDPFMEYTVPQAVLKFKQGFGRLIRSREDRGVVLILDRRIVSKGYGRLFLHSLPPARTSTGSGQEVLAEMSAFFRPSASSPASQQS